MDTKEIQQAIDANLTTEVAEKLHAFLNEGAQACIDLAAVETELKGLRELGARATLVAKQKETFDELRRELDIDRRVLKALEIERESTDGQILELARIVFGNPKGVDDGPR